MCVPGSVRSGSVRSLALSEKLTKKRPRGLLDPPHPFYLPGSFMVNATLYFVCAVTGIMLRCTANRTLV